MRRESQVRFWEGRGVRVPSATRLVAGFQYKRDAERFLCDLKDRLAVFSLELHPDKTRLLEFGKFAIADRRARGERRPETFDFLGFTHYCRTTRKGRFGLGAEADRETGQPNPEAYQGRTATADAPEPT